MYAFYLPALHMFVLHLPALHMFDLVLFLGVVVEEKGDLLINNSTSSGSRLQQGWWKIIKPLLGSIVEGYNYVGCCIR